MTQSEERVPTAILSVSDKTGLAPFASGLASMGWSLVSTGGTARTLREAGLSVRDVSDLTGHPEMMDGRVKTLHPAVHAGILARRTREDDAAALAAQAYEPIDLVVVNLYPFREAVARGATLPEAMEQVDIGGPTMLRAAAKNHADVAVVVDPADYARVLDALRGGPLDGSLRRELARKVFEHTAQYDAAIAHFLAEQPDAGSEAGRGTEAGSWPPSLTLRLERVQDLRYGENPDQPATFYALREDSADGTGGALAAGLPWLAQLQGKALSFNNLMDVDAAVMAVSPWADTEDVACAVLKHTTPCGLALGRSGEDAYRRALATDPTSAFGGIVALNVPVDGAAAEAMATHFLEVIVAPGFDDGARDVLSRKKNLRLIDLPIERADRSMPDYRSVRGGILAQRRMWMSFPEDDWTIVTERQPESQEMRDLRFAWRVVASVKSNAIVLAREAQALGIGAGQMSRVDASRIAVMKAQEQQFELAGSVLASDAFFPFRDGVDAAAEAGVRAVIQPGGSIRDEEVVQAANEHGITMVFTGRRVFRH